MLKSKRILLWLAAITLVACQNQEFSSADDYQAVVSMSADAAQMEKTPLLTYYMANEVFDAQAEGADPMIPSHDFDDDLLAAVADHMTAAGFDRVESLDEADVVVETARIAQLDFDYTGRFALHVIEDGFFDLAPPAKRLIYPSDGILIVAVNPAVHHLRDDQTVYPTLFVAGIHNDFRNLVPDLFESGLQAAFAAQPDFSATGDSK